MYYYNLCYSTPSELQSNIYYYPITYQHIPFPSVDSITPNMLFNQIQNLQHKMLIHHDVKKTVLKDHHQQKRTENVIKQQKTGDVRQARIIHIHNHNVLPNNINMILSCIRRVKKSGRLVQKIIEKLNYKKLYSVKKFYSYQHYLKENCTDFVNNEAISAIINYQDPNCAPFSLEEQRFYNKITRILISTYYKQISILDVLGEGKIKRSSVKDHLMIHRYIQCLLKGPKSQKIKIKHL